MKKLTAVWVTLWESGYIHFSNSRPDFSDSGAAITGSTLISNVPIEAGVFADESAGKHEVYGESTEKLKALCEEVRRIMTTMSEPAAVEMLQEAIDTYGPPDGV